MHLCSNIFMYQKIDNISWTLIPPNANHFEHAQNIAWNWKLSQTFSRKLSSVLESNLPAPHSSTPISPLGNVIKRLNNKKKKLNEKNLHVWSPFFFYFHEYKSFTHNQHNFLFLNGKQWEHKRVTDHWFGRFLPCFQMKKKSISGNCEKN